jgi:hypothetical protein
MMITIRPNHRPILFRIQSPSIYALYDVKIISIQSGNALANHAQLKYLIKDKVNCIIHVELLDQYNTP